MKLIKVVGFLFQFGLIGLAVATIYLVIASDRDRGEILAFLIGSEPPAAGYVEAGTAPFSYADAVNLSASSVVTIYTTKTVTEKSHPLLDDPVF